jgi:hypothetical protein
MEYKFKNKKRLTGGGGFFMNLKSKIVGYFETYWKNNVLLKSIAVVVTVCFLINISNLPAFAKDKDVELLKKE